MELEQKIDSLADNVIALAGQTEKRAKNAEQLAVQAQRVLDSSSNRLDGSAERIRQEAAEAVRSGLEQSVGKFTERLETTGRWLLETVRDVEVRQRKSAKDLKKLVWVSVAVFVLTGLLCFGTVIYLIQAVRTENKQIEWIADINKAVQDGKLVQCSEDGGVCVKIGKKTVRLDR
ncbi:MAG: hypothetical protein D8H97_00605 [Neisseria sp.]|nr:MAG: hypothetical protein D8H97_00605 [Neisseria sp.]